jgi:hypothetical protein
MRISTKSKVLRRYNLFLDGAYGSWDIKLEAGSDTTQVSIGQMIAGAAMYLDWVIRVREQLDSVCGKNGERLPEWSDYEILPYITAVVKESFRYIQSEFVSDDRWDLILCRSGLLLC